MRKCECLKLASTLLRSPRELHTASSRAETYRLGHQHARLQGNHDHAVQSKNVRSSYRLPKSPKSHPPPKFAHAVTTPSFDRCFVRWTTRVMHAWTWRGFSTTSPIQGVPPPWGPRGPPGPLRSDSGGPFSRSTYRSPVFEHMWICFAILKCVKRASPPNLYLPGRVTASSSAEKNIFH